jgi:hypothetical protein
MLDQCYRRDQKPDAQGFDEIRLVTIPRYKESELSGDEWRISIKAEFYRKGKLIHEIGCGSNMNHATALLYWHYCRALDDGKGYFVGEDDICDQEGCSDPATVTYQKKKRWCSQCGESQEIEDAIVIRKFCGRHKERGDCGLDDADDNYERL